MGEQTNLNRSEGIKELKALAEEIRIAMFCTKTNNIPLETRPMATQQVDENGNIWFFSGAESDKNLEIKAQDKVQLIYANPSASKFLSVSGSASQSRDRKKIDELWNKMAEAWFKGGKDDPSLTVICVKPEEAYYWDTKHGKMISLLKIAASAVTGMSKDDGVEGKI